MENHQGIRLSHILIRVSDLSSAVADYRAAGFTVTLGADPASAHNAMIYFEDGAFLELFTPPKTSRLTLIAASVLLGKAAAARFRLWTQPGEGFVEYAFESVSPKLAAEVVRLRAAGVRTSRALSRARQRLDNRKVRWQLSFPDNLELPFVMSAYDPPDEQSESARVHANGAKKIVGLHIEHPQPQDLGEELQRFIGGHPSDHGISLSQGGRYMIDRVTIAGLQEPVDASKMHGAKILPYLRATADQ
ncbi:MAG: VOC family protein [Pseudomonadota bacterium]